MTVRKIVPEVFRVVASDNRCDRKCPNIERTQRLKPGWRGKGLAWEVVYRCSVFGMDVGIGHKALLTRPKMCLNAEIDYLKFRRNKGETKA